jgi:DNA-binding transcriptional MerR regulator
MGPNKSSKIYYSISEVSDLTGIKPYVLRFWEKEFPILKPKKNRAGNRSYQLKDIDTINQIKHLLYDDGYTIEGARTRLKDSKQKKRGGSKQKENIRLKSILSDIKKELNEILKTIS